MTLKRKAISSVASCAAALFVIYLAPFPFLSGIGIIIGSLGLLRGIRALLEYRRMPEGAASRRYAIIAGVGVVAISILVPWAIWNALGMHVDNPTGFSSPAVVADYTGIKPPAAARNIRTAEWHKGMMFDEFVRFEAPVEVCVKYAKEVVHDRPLIPNPPVSDPSKLGSRYIPDLTWFDLSRASNVIGTDREPSVWVDQNRGVFYFYEGF